MSLRCIYGHVRKSRVTSQSIPVLERQSEILWREKLSIDSCPWSLLFTTETDGPLRYRHHGVDLPALTLWIVPHA